VCPVKIPITDILLRLRRNRVREKNARHWTSLYGGKSLMELMTWKGWKQVLSQPSLYRTQASFLSQIGNLLPAQMPVLRQWARSRSLPRFSKKPLHRLVEEAGIDHE